MCSVKSIHALNLHAMEILKNRLMLRLSVFEDLQRWRIWVTEELLLLPAKRPETYRQKSRVGSFDHVRGRTHIKYRFIKKAVGA